MAESKEHTASLRDPADFDKKSYSRTNGGKIGKVKVDQNIGIIWGKLKDDESGPIIAQSLRFPITSWTAKRAREWLKDNKIKYIEFEPATKSDNMTIGERDVYLDTDEKIITFEAMVTLKEDEGGTGNPKFESLAIEPCEANDTIIEEELTKSNFKEWESLDMINTHVTEDVLNVAGTVLKSWIEGAGKLFIEGEIDLDTRDGPGVHKNMKKGKVALSIGARVLEWSWDKEKQMMKILKWVPHHIAYIRKGSQAVSTAVPHKLTYSKGMALDLQSIQKEKISMSDETGKLKAELKGKEEDIVAMTTKATEAEAILSKTKAELEEATKNLADFQKKEDAKRVEELKAEVTDLITKSSETKEYNLAVMGIKELEETRNTLALEIANSVKPTKKAGKPVKMGNDERKKPRKDFSSVVGFPQ